MDEFKKSAFMKKFPFLGNIFFDPDEIRVKRIDRDVLLRPRHPEEDRIIFIVREKELLSVHVNERPIDTLFRIGIGTVNAIVAVDGGNSSVCEYTIYLPKENILKLIAGLEKRAAMELENEIESC